MNNKTVSLMLSFSFFLILGGCQVDQNKDESQPTNQYQPQTREYFVAAEKVSWDFAPQKKDLMNNTPLPSPWGDKTVYAKYQFIEYTDASFSEKKQQDKHLGILGPIIRGVGGDTIKVTFKNRTENPYSMHPHGLRYDKINEGVKGVPPGDTFVYTWEVGEASLPTENEGSSKLWIYHSHVDSTQDIYDGLIGGMIITKPEFANADGTPKDIDREFINMYFIFDESVDGMNEEQTEGSLMHAINGYVFANIPGLEMKKGEKVRWHLFAMGTEIDLHTPHWHGETVLDSGIRKDVVPLLPSEMRTVDMIPENVGMWMYHCHVTDHITAGMTAMYKITN